MFERFSPHARGAVVLAQEQARRLSHAHIGTEHLLLGLLAEHGSQAATMLREHGLTLRQAQFDVEAIVGRGSAARQGHIPFSGRAKKVLELTLREALAAGATTIGSEHILLGLLREGDGVACQVLAKRAIAFDRLRDTIRAGGGAEREAGAARPAAYTPAASEILDAAQQLAGPAAMGSHHLLDAMVRAEGSVAAIALANLGIQPDELSAAMESVRLEETTDVTADQASARMMQLSLSGETLQVVLRDAETLTAAHLLLDDRGGSLQGDEPGTEPLLTVLSAVRTTLFGLHCAMTDTDPTDGVDGLSSTPMTPLTALVQRVVQSRRRRHQGGSR